MAAKTLLVLGSSNMTFTAAGTSTSQLLEAELGRIEPGGWSIRNVDLAPGRRMADEAEALIDKDKPDVTLLSLNAQPSVYESVIVKVRRRWPSLLGAVTAIEGFLWERAQYGDPTANSIRALVYRLPQALGLALLGGEPALAVEHHVENVASCLQRLAGREDTPLLVRLPVGGAPATPARNRRNEVRLRRLKQGIIASCRRHRIPYVDVAGSMTNAGGSAGHGADSTHLDLETRRFEARELASQVAALSPARKPGREALKL